MPDKVVALPDGRTVAFPDTMADADIAAVIKKQMAPMPAEPHGSTGFEAYGEPLQTAEGRAGQAEAVRGTFVGAAKAAARSVYETPALEPKTESEKVGGAALGIMAGAAASVAVPGAIRSILPSTQRAGAALGEVKAAAGTIPIDMTKPGNTALQIWEESDYGAGLPQVVRKFVQRATKPGSEPITYAEAKQFQSNVSQMSASESMSLKPNTRRLLGQLNADLKGSLESAADTVGMGQKFTAAMKEYRQAAQLHGLTEDAQSQALKWALRGAIGGAAWGGASWLIRHLVD